MQNYTFRITPAQDLFDSIQAFAMKKHAMAGRGGEIISSIHSETLPE
jgi:hypothetical protein